MKTRLLSVLLVAVMAGMVMAGCRAGEVRQTVESAGRAAEGGMASAADAWKRPVEMTAAAASEATVKPALTPEEAQNIALKHAGLTADQVIGLRTEYEIEHGIGQYDVEFHHETWEYDYEIQADTGEILSFSKDD